MCFHLFDEFGYYALLNISNWTGHALMNWTEHALMKMNWTGHARYLESSIELSRIVVPIYSLLIL